MADQFDVIVVGARVAGAPLATHLARAGLSVCLLDRARFPSDTLSTHIFQDLGALRRLGVLDRLLATGAPLLSEITFGFDTVVVQGSYPDLAMLCVRRPALDQILLDNAIEAGADARTRTWVTDLVEEGGRVAGVSTRDAGGVVSTLRAPVVIGADGRNSTVAKLVGARRYNVTESERAGGWAYYEGSQEHTPAATFQRNSDSLWAWCPTDGGLFLVICVPPMAAVASLRDGDGSGFDRTVEANPALAARLTGARRISKPVVVARWQGYFRESAGRGWALVGDAGHFKDPTPGLGISDAVRQAERLASFVTAGLREGSVDEQLQAYWTWRDRDAVEFYWFAQDMGRAGAMPPITSELFATRLKRPDGFHTLLEILHHQRLPSELFTIGDLLAACGRLLVRRTVPTRQVLSDVKEMIQLDRQRKRLMKHPRFEEGEAERQPDDDLLPTSAGRSG